MQEVVVTLRGTPRFVALLVPHPTGGGGLPPGEGGWVTSEGSHPSDARPVLRLISLTLRWNPAILDVPECP